MTSNSIKNKKIDSIIISIFLILFSGFLLFGTIILINSVVLSEISIVISGLAVIFYFIVIPKNLFKKYCFVKTQYQRLLVYLPLSILTLYLLKAKIFAVYFIAIGFGEEFLFRVCILNLLISKFNNIQAIIINALLFGFVLHLNNDFVENLLIRVPLGLMFCLIKEKIGYLECALLHGFYDVVISVL